ncbi:DNRLRE domain-containing protein [Lacipirellula parvula]|uniref:Uncharacterized protein n=1 Tax=Lacipirellula parvula TaxID=2650471 RepID=A0A5K7X3M8_9BACT|nr:DNRLRE domain-containing protein [Lacipirellula parvula]BBO31120.1 hypothetical protein PLANPX_0732 [Lacipirellula parvula]
MKVRCFALLALCVSLATAPLAQAATIMLGASKDASIFQNNVGNSSGAGNGLIAGTNAQSSPRRGAIAFDIAGALPAGAIIQDVKLHLTLASVAGSGGGDGGNSPTNVTVDLRRLTKDWGEGTTLQQMPPTDNVGGQGQGAVAGNGDATWNSNFHGTSLWTTPGGDFASPSASQLIDALTNVAKTWTSAAMITDVQSWLTNPSGNFGWMLVNQSEAASSTARTFYSSEVATAAFHPQLEITYATATVPEPGTIVLGLAASGCCLLVARRRRTENLEA